MKNSKVNDKWLFTFLYPILGVSFVHIGNDNTFGELIQIPSYYTDIILSLAVLYAIGFYIQWVCYRLEQCFDWEIRFKTRLIYQFAMGLVLPTLFAVAVELIYLQVLQIPIAESSIFYLELPIIIFLLLLINLIYVVLYFRPHAASLRIELTEKHKEQEVLAEKYLIVKQGNQSIQVPNSSIAYFVLKDKLTFLVTNDNQRFLFDKTMQEVLDILPSQQFYRLNRQLIAKRGSIVKCTPTETRRLKIVLNPPLEEDVFLAKANASKFMSWFRQQ